jgi:hypothetical protein
MDTRDTLLENLYRLRCDCEAQLAQARKGELQGSALEIEEQLTMIDEMIERSCGVKPV